MKYRGKCPAHRIKVYYAGIHDDYAVLCKFKNISPGDTITCSSTGYDTFRDSTFIVIEYDPECEFESDSSDDDPRRLIQSQFRDDDDHRGNSSSSDHDTDSDEISRGSVNPSEDEDESQPEPVSTMNDDDHSFEDNHDDDYES